MLNEVAARRWWTVNPTAGLMRCLLCQILDLGLLWLKLWDTNVCCVSHPGYAVLLYSPPNCEDNSGKCCGGKWKRGRTIGGQGQVCKLEFYELGLGRVSPPPLRWHLCKVLSKGVGGWGSLGSEEPGAETWMWVWGGNCGSSEVKEGEMIGWEVAEARSHRPLVKPSILLQM